VSDDVALTTDAAPVPRGSYVHARVHDGLVWVTGQIGRDPGTGEFVVGGFEAELQQAISNLEAILVEAGSSLAQVIRTEVQFVDEGDLDAMNRIIGERFPQPYPARTSYGVAFLWKGARVQISCVAAVGASAGRGA
jgi:2-iminobutanoate/2-iminopropanoate deaminase